MRDAEIMFFVIMNSPFRKENFPLFAALSSRIFAPEGWKHKKYTTVR